MFFVPFFHFLFASFIFFSFLQFSFFHLCFCFCFSNNFYSFCVYSSSFYFFLIFSNFVFCFFWDFLIFFYLFIFFYCFDLFCFLVCDSFFTFLDDVYIVNHSKNFDAPTPWKLLAFLTLFFCVNFRRFLSNNLVVFLKKNQRFFTKIFGVSPPKIVSVLFCVFSDPYWFFEVLVLPY